MDVLSIVVPLPARDRLVRVTCVEIAHAARPLVWDGIIDDYEIVLVNHDASKAIVETAEVFASRDRNVRVVHPDGIDPMRNALAMTCGSIVACVREDVTRGAALLKPALKTLRGKHADVVTVDTSMDDAPFIMLRREAADASARSGIAAKRNRAKRVLIDERGIAVEKERRMAVLRPRPALAAFTAVAGLAAATVIIASTMASSPAPTGTASIEVASAPQARRARSDVVAPDVIHRHGSQYSRLAAPIPLPPTFPLSKASTQPMPTPLNKFTATSESTCASDVTASLQREVDALPANSQLDLRAGGCYLTSGPLLIRDRRGITIDGHGAQIRSGAIACENSRDVRITNIGLRTASGKGTAVGVRDCNVLEISDAHVAAAGKGLDVSGATKDLTVRNSSVDADDDAISIRSGTRLSFERVVAQSAHQSAVILQGTAGEVLDGVEIHDSTLTSGRLPFGAFGEGAVRNVAVYSNRLFGGHQKIIVAPSSSAASRGWIVYDNWGDEVNGLGPYVIFKDAKNVSVVQNVFHANVVPLRAAVAFSSAAGDLRLLDNDFTGACRAYTADSKSAKVKSKGNRTSDC